MDRPTDAEIAATLQFNAEFVGLLGRVVAQLYKDAGGRFPDHIERIIHERLPAVSEAAVAVPERISALAMFDQFVAMFPPRE